MIFHFRPEEVLYIQGMFHQEYHYHQFLKGACKENQYNQFQLSYFILN